MFNSYHNSVDRNFITATLTLEYITDDFAPNKSMVIIFKSDGLLDLVVSQFTFHVVFV